MSVMNDYMNLTIIYLYQVFIIKEDMKSNDYLEKYGEKALEIYKKSLRSQEESHAGSPLKLPMKKSSKSSRKHLHSSKSKSKIIIDTNQQVNHKISLPEKGKKKLLLSGLSTPKNKTLKGTTTNRDNRDERNKSTSTKKKQMNEKISEKLHNAVYHHKSAKSMLRNAMECLDMIAEEENKVGKWVNQFKEIMMKIVEELAPFRQKYKEAMAKNKSLEKEVKELREWRDAKVYQSESVKKKSLESLMVEENRHLRESVKELRERVQQYERKEMALIGVIEQLKGNAEKRTMKEELMEEKLEKDKQMRG